MERDSFIFRKEWKDAISTLPGNVRLEIYEAIIEYSVSGEVPPLSPMAELAFNFAKATLDKDSKKYEQICKKRSEAAKRSHASNATLAANAGNAANNEGDNEGDNEGEPLKKGKKKAAHAAPLETRKEDFYNSLVGYVSKYGRETVREFFDYWSETNKSKTKMRWELQKTWETGKRLATWASKNDKFNSNGTGNSRDNPESRARDAADIIARLAAEDDANQ